MKVIQTQIPMLSLVSKVVHKARQPTAFGANIKVAHVLKLSDAKVENWFGFACEQVGLWPSQTHYQVAK